MAEKQTLAKRFGPIAFGSFLLNLLASERAYHAERAEKPVIEKEHILPHEIFEPANAKGPLPALVFLHGWPDDVAMFRPFAKHLSSRYRCVNCNLPGYPIPPIFEGNRGTMPERTWGFGFDEAALALKNTILATCPDATSVTLVVHDWGAVTGYLMHESNPDLVQRIVGLDVGWRMNGMTIPGALGIVGYQAFLNFLYLLPSTLGSPLSSIEAFLLARYHDKDAGPVTNEMNWPYRSAWRDFVSDGPLKRMDEYVPKNLPFLFLYGERLPAFIRFSDEAWVKQVEKSCQGVSRVKSFDGSHWFLRKFTDEVLDTIDKWLAESETHMPARRLVDFYRVQSCDPFLLIIRPYLSFFWRNHFSYQSTFITLVLARYDPTYFRPSPKVFCSFQVIIVVFRCILSRIVQDDLRPGRVLSHEIRHIIHIVAYNEPYAVLHGLVFSDFLLGIRLVLIPL